MKLSVGKVAFPIEFDNGDKDVIYFNPSDPELGSRLINAKKRIEDRVNELDASKFVPKEAEKNIELPEKITDYSELSEEQRGVLESRAAALAAITDESDRILKEEIDRAFGGDISSVVFKHCSPMAPVNGEYFIIQFLNAITPEIQKYVSETNAEVEKKMGKHVDKYRKKQQLKN